MYGNHLLAPHIVKSTLKLDVKIIKYKGVKESIKK